MKLDRSGGPGFRVQPGKPDIKWLPGVGQLEGWRLDIQTRLVTASNLGVVIAGPWARRPFEPDRMFDELAIEKSLAVWFQALEQTTLEVLLDLLYGKQTSIPRLHERILEARRKFEKAEDGPKSIGGRQILFLCRHEFDADPELCVASNIFDLTALQWGEDTRDGAYNYAHLAHHET